MIRDLLYDVETEIMEDIIALLKSKEDLDIAAWKADRLAQYGKLTRQVEELVRRYTEAIRSGASEEIQQAAIDAIKKIEGTVKKLKSAGVELADVLPEDMDPGLKMIIETWASKASDQINLVMAGLLENAPRVYIDTINRVTLQVVTGAMSKDEAMARACGEWIENGIPAITDRKGREWTVESYADMVIRSNTTRVATDVQFQRTEEYGLDLIEVSSHAGARPLCAPYQGKIYSMSGKSKKYPAFSTTSYGEPAGLFGINCGHWMRPFIEGVSEKVFEPTKDEGKNERMYEESQKQRRLEREIRAAKRELDMAKKLGNDTLIANAKRKIQHRTDLMEQFIDETGRKRNYSRERVFGG